MVSSLSGDEQGDGGRGGFLFFFKHPSFLTECYHHHPLIQWAVFVPASVVENNIVRGNQPSVSVLVWGGRGLNVADFVMACWFLLVLLS